MLVMRGAANNRNRLSDMNWLTLRGSTYESPSPVYGVIDLSTPHPPVPSREGYQSPPVNLRRPRNRYLTCLLPSFAPLILIYFRGFAQADAA